MRTLKSFCIPVKVTVTREVKAVGDMPEPIKQDLYILSRLSPSRRGRGFGH
ncbi:unnamed protein product [Leptidea sinapis]|uniref:Uncharacterized protein n=1 Tax=Leptidea sinapis TaxID=189913 RepID=A0A5E4QU13_9NEOP|nr:unnamed protein product [Leptidea sinapis]